MEREDEEVVMVDNDIDDSDEGDSVPAEWRQIGFNKYSVADARESEWEYMDNEVVHGSKYPNLEVVNEIVKL
jgi:hypothetical protein